MVSVKKNKKEKVAAGSGSQVSTVSNFKKAQMSYYDYLLSNKIGMLHNQRFAMASSSSVSYGACMSSADSPDMCKSMAMSRGSYKPKVKMSKGLMRSSAKKSSSGPGFFSGIATMFTSSKK